jgi:hypothetical protein
MHYSNYPPPVPVVRKSRAPWIALAAVLGVVGVMFVGCVALVASTDPTQSPTAGAAVTEGGNEKGGTTAGKTKSKGLAKIGKPVKDGKFTFTVRKMDASTTYGENIFQQRAEGVFVVLTVKVTNHGDEAQTFEATNQYLFDGRGRKFDAETGAFTANDVFLNSINPGNSVTGKIAFDVPKKTKIAAVELHDSIFSAGVRVDLT